MPSKNDVEKQLAFEKLEGQLKDIVTEADYCELWGYDLTALLSAGGGKVILERILRKFLDANDYEVDATRSQLTKTLKWRKEFQPLHAAFRETHKEALNRLGLITVGPRQDGRPRVTTWNLYGAVENRQELFGDLDAFLRWRVGLMELGIALLDFSDPETSHVSQVHDYYNVSFFKMDPNTKQATSTTIKLFQDHYPEILDVKWFVNVPTLMGWMFSFAKLFLSKETVAKFRVLSNGHDMANDIGDYVPENYGGKAKGDLASIAVKEVVPKNESLVDASTMPQDAHDGEPANDNGVEPEKSELPVI